MSGLLIPCEPLQVLPSLAKVVGLNEAIFLQQLHYWLQKSRHEHDGRVWVYNTFEEWQEQFPFWSLRTMQRIAASLVKRKLLMVHKFGSKDWDQKNWYSLDYEALSLINTDHAKLSSSITTKRRTLDHAKMAGSYKDQEITQETTSEIARARGYKQPSKQSEPKSLYPPPDFEITDALYLWLAEMCFSFSEPELAEATQAWHESRNSEPYTRARTLAMWQADWQKFIRVYWNIRQQRNGNGHKNGNEQPYTGPVRTKPDLKLQNCPDCRGMGNVMIEVDGRQYAKVCKHERSGVVAA